MVCKTAQHLSFPSPSREFNPYPAYFEIREPLIEDGFEVEESTELPGGADARVFMDRGH